MRRFVAVLLLAVAVVSSAATKKKPAPKSIAPQEIAHPIALFLASLSSDGKRGVTYKAQALGTHFFFEESTGVTVYTFNGDQYVRTEFLKGYTLKRAVNRYEGKR